MATSKVCSAKSRLWASPVRAATAAAARPGPTLQRKQEVSPLYQTPAEKYRGLGGVFGPESASTDHWRNVVVSAAASEALAPATAAVANEGVTTVSTARTVERATRER